MLEKLNALNDFHVYSVTDPEFRMFGRVISDIDVTDIITAANNIPTLSEGTAYIASEPAFECLDIKNTIQTDLFGELCCQLGYCHGKNSFLNGAEWHTSSEINIATTPLVLMLAHISDMCDNKIDSSCFKAFYLEKGTAVEVYSTSLHFCPCMTSPDGFGCVVALPVGTNTDLELDHASKLIFRKNKWIISHFDNTALINRGVLPGITGENLKLNF